MKTLKFKSDSACELLDFEQRKVIEKFAKTVDGEALDNVLSHLRDDRFNLFTDTDKKIDAVESAKRSIDEYRRKIGVLTVRNTDLRKARTAIADIVSKFGIDKSAANGMFCKIDSIMSDNESEAKEYADKINSTSIIGVSLDDSLSGLKAAQNILRSRYTGIVGSSLKEPLKFVRDNLCVVCGCSYATEAEKKQALNILRVVRECIKQIKLGGKN